MATVIAPSLRDVSLVERYTAVRSYTEQLCRSLEIEDYVVSSMPDVSPTKWHLAHTSWFFETFVLAPLDPSYQPLDPRYAFLFNSYYVQAGERHCRAQRGLVTRPTVAEVYAYRRYVDEHMVRLLERFGDHEAVVVLGLNHEQQHQELLLTDIKHVLWTNPMRPALWSAPSDDIPAPFTRRHTGASGREQFTKMSAGIQMIGHEGSGFSFDNESPRHRIFLEAFAIANHLVTNRDYLAFIEDRGYQRPDLWLAAGWAIVQQEKRDAPLYWEKTPDGWREFSLFGMQSLDLDAPVAHVTYFEADAFARWAGKRLPTEPEWEVAARANPAIADLFDTRWQWTSSAYVAYPGYAPARGAIGEYNGKWMADQWVLRGSSCATPVGHSRLTYRNFFASDTRWQFTGIRLAESV